MNAVATRATTMVLAQGLAIAGALWSCVASAADLMPDFANVPAGWTTDRFDPHSFANVGTFQGRNDVLGIEITRAEGATARPAGQQSMFYDTQGRQHAVSGGAGSALFADLYLPLEWADAQAGNERTDMWGVMVDGASAVTDYPIIGFTNYGGAPRYRAWDENLNGGAGDWVDLLTPVQFGGWTSFGIEFTGASFVYTIDGAPVYTDNTVNGSTGFAATIMQAYNFYDPAVAGATPVDYTAHWSNAVAAQVPEPATLALVGFGLVGAGLGRRRSGG